LLNAEGVDTPAAYYFKQTGKRATHGNNIQWGSTTIMQLLKNQVYIGNMVQGKRKVSSFKTKKRLVATPDDWIIVENTHEAIIDGYTWDCAQQRISGRKNSASNGNAKINGGGEINIFSGMMRCADCGAAMIFNRKVRKNGEEKKFYRCSRYVNNGSNSCTTHTIDVEVLDAVILHDIRHHAKTAIQDERRLLDRLMVFSDETSKTENAAKEKVLRDTDSRIAFIENAGKKLFEEKIIGNVPDSLFKRMLNDYEREIAELNDKATLLRRQIQDDRSSRADIQRWINLMKECASINELDRATAYQLIDHVSVHEQSDDCGIRTQTVDINYNFVGCIS